MWLILIALSLIGCLYAEAPKNPFRISEEAYRSFGDGAVFLEPPTPRLVLPHLDDEIVYLGVNQRPDRKEETFYLSLSKSGEIKRCMADQKIYLNFSDCAYHFSPDNQQSALWIEPFSPQADRIKLKVSMRDFEGNIVKEPTTAHILSLQIAQDGKSKSFELGGHRVDGSFLLRQHARLIGPDRFLEIHGGTEHAEVNSRERLDFADGSRSYFCFVKDGDFLIWKEGRWNTPEVNDQTENYPLLVVKKIEEKTVYFEVWDQTGTTGVPIHLVRVRCVEAFPDIASEFRFVGAKTWSQFIFECRGSRLLLRSDDWLLLTPEGWKKIATCEEIDDYVNRKLFGPLLVVGKMTKKGGKEVLLGNVFSVSRTEVKELCLSEGSK